MKKLILPLLSLMLITSCQKQTLEEDRPGVVSNENSSVTNRSANSKIDVCHREGNGSWHMINVSINALPAHLAHGDIVPDADGDGYTKANPCGIGNQDDCDDDNAATNPGAIEICGNGIDDNCDGNTDEGCTEVTVCNQVWMAKNLDVSTYRNGDLIPEVTDPTAWAALTTGAWCYYANNSANGPIYGKLYNWYAVNDPRGLAPLGWHVPSDGEWNILATCIDPLAVINHENVQSTTAGGSMKEIGTTHWLSPNTGATNSSGFTGLPGNWRFPNGFFVSAGNYGSWWSSTETQTFYAWYRFLIYTDSKMYNGGANKHFGYSVRCIKD